MSINIRKALTGSLYNKIEKLTIKSLTETDSGKLISIISGDLQGLTRSMGGVTNLIAAPLINLTAYAVIWKTSGLEYALITFIWWVALLLMQHYSSELVKKLKYKESGYNDERQRLITDMVVGVRTIKAYAWENHYLTKLKTARKN